MRLAQFQLQFVFSLRMKTAHYFSTWTTEGSQYANVQHNQNHCLTDVKYHLPKFLYVSPTHGKGWLLISEQYASFLQCNFRYLLLPSCCLQ